MVRLFFSLIKWSLIAWGLLCLVTVIGGLGFIVWQFTLGNKTQIDVASPKEVRFVLNNCNLGEQRLKKIIHSYKSKRSFTGDHLDAYELEITELNTTELLPKKNAPSQWFRGDNLPDYLNDAVKFTGSQLENGEAKWIPWEKALRSPMFYVYPNRISYYGTKITAIELTFLRLSDKRLFYISLKI